MASQIGAQDVNIIVPAYAQFMMIQWVVSRDFWKALMEHKGTVDSISHPVWSSSVKTHCCAVSCRPRSNLYAATCPFVSHDHCVARVGFQLISGFVGLNYQSSTYRFRTGYSTPSPNNLFIVSNIENAHLKDLSSCTHCK